MTTTDDRRDVSALSEGLGPLVRNAHNDEPAYSTNQVAAKVAAERERCANAVRYWLAGYAPTAGTHEARYIAHILDGRIAPEGPNV